MTAEHPLFDHTADTRWVASLIAGQWRPDADVPLLTPLQRFAVNALSFALRTGPHNVTRARRWKAAMANPDSRCVRVVPDARHLATADSDALLRLVVAAASAAVRVEVAPAGTMLAIYFHRRDPASASIMHGHPTLEATMADLTRWCGGGAR